MNESLLFGHYAVSFFNVYLSKTRHTHEYKNTIAWLKKSISIAIICLKYLNIIFFSLGTLEKGVGSKVNPLLIT